MISGFFSFPNDTMIPPNTLPAFNIKKLHFVIGHTKP